MERSKIPKPPTRLPVFAPRSKSPQPSTSSRSNNVLKHNPLRRRSKSVADLRSNMRPLTVIKPSLKPLLEKNKSQKPTVGQKRTAPSKSENEAPKPKVSKKIPDWDYKTRFQDLTGKYKTVLENFKETKTKIEDLEMTNTALSTEVSDLTKAGAELKYKYEDLLVENDRTKENLLVVTQENKKIAEELSILQTEYKDLKLKHEALTKQHDEAKTELSLVSKETKEIKTELSQVKIKCSQLEETVHLLKTSVEKNELQRKILHNMVQDLKGNIRVYCRIRPPLSYESTQLECLFQFPDEGSLEIRKSRESIRNITGKAIDYKQEFTFDRVFPPQTTQEEIFDDLSQLVQSALDGYHVCIFAYGQTGSGKTHTMQGTSEDQGVIPRTIDFIFEKIVQLKDIYWEYRITVSFLEIYNENIKDLLQPKVKQNYELRFNEGKGVTVTNLKNVEVTSSEQLKELMKKALGNRSTAATHFNEHSSRSHAVTKITLEGHNSNLKTTYIGSINLVDLAGSENAKMSTRMEETKNINKSLSALGTVVLALYNKESHVPFRNSKLTYLLQSCLGGNSKTLMFVNISPFEDCYTESINSLRFAANVKEVKISAKRSKTITQTGS